MRSLHAAALTRAYRTLCTGLGGSVVSSAATAALVAASGDEPAALRDALIVLGGSLGGTLISAVGSFFLAIAGGLPEAPARHHGDPTGDEHTID